MLEKTNIIEVNQTGLTYHIGFRHSGSFNLGIALSKISFQKETQGIFSETNQFGIGLVDGTINYWSFPISCSFTLPSYSGTFGKNTRLRNAIRIRYVPSFEGKSDYRVSTSG